MPKNCALRCSLVKSLSPRYFSEQWYVSKARSFGARQHLVVPEGVKTYGCVPSLASLGISAESNAEN